MAGILMGSSSAHRRAAGDSEEFWRKRATVLAAAPRYSATRAPSMRAQCLQLLLRQPTESRINRCLAFQRPAAE